MHRSFQRWISCRSKYERNAGDIIQAIVFEDREKVVEFCRGIQSSSTVDSHVVPHAWDMPGYEDRVVMASGGFVEGSSIEMSADGPIRKPYSVFYQGGVSFQQTKLAAMRVLENFASKGFVDLTYFRINQLGEYI